MVFSYRGPYKFLSISGTDGPFSFLFSNQVRQKFDRFLRRKMNQPSPSSSFSN